MEANEDADNECVCTRGIACFVETLTRVYAPRADTRNSGYAEAVVTVDNYTSKAHTVIQVRTRDRKGLFYDSMRATKDLKVNVSYGKVCQSVSGGLTLLIGASLTTLVCPPKVEVRESGICELDLFVTRTGNQEVERRLCQRCAHPGCVLRHIGC